MLGGIKALLDHPSTDAKTNDFPSLLITGITAEATGRFHLIRRELQSAVTPIHGSIVACEIKKPFSYIHVGVYVGDNRIVELTGDGTVHEVSKEAFLQKNTQNAEAQLFVACSSDGSPIGHSAIAQRALEQCGDRISYDIVQENCYRFTARCITGKEPTDFSAYTAIIGLLKMVAYKPAESSKTPFVYLDFHKLLQDSLNAGKEVFWFPWGQKTSIQKRATP